MFGNHIKWILLTAYIGVKYFGLTFQNHYFIVSSNGKKTNSLV